MSKITLLHFSDAHWSEKSAESVEIVRNAMIEDLKILKRDQSISFDMVIFTGDLVLAGQTVEDFEVAHNAIFTPILQEIGLDEKSLFICPGNHDASRQIVRDNEFIETGLKQSLNSIEAVNSLLQKMDNSDPTAKLALARIQNYEHYHAKKLSKADASSGTVKIYKRRLKGKQVGIACFDNSWRSTGEAGGVDRNNLLLGERNVDFATNEMREMDLAIAIYHHPISWLAEFDAAAVSPRLNEKFDLLAYGHVHTTEPELKTTVNGNALVSQSGSMFSGRNYYNGYQIIEIDTDVCEAEFWLRTYFDKPARRFGPAENIVAGGKAKFSYHPTRGTTDPVTELVLRELRPEVRKQALEQFNISDIGSDICSDPHTAFICPPLFADYEGQDSSLDENDDAGGVAQSDIKKRSELSVSEILRTEADYLIVGAREVGKTSLAHYIAVRISEGDTDIARVPVIIDFRNFKSNLYSVKKLAAAYIGTMKNGFDFETALEAGNISIIIDNYSGVDKEKKASLEKLIRAYPKTKWILLADDRFGSLNGKTSDNDLINDVLVANIAVLPRRSIREMVKRWCERTGTSNEEAFTTVMAQITTNDLPRTGYIVTLLLWALHQNSKLERINESVLIMNMVDYLLGKADFRSALEGEFDATSKEITLQSFAEFIKDHNGVVNSNDATEFLIHFFREKGLNYDAKTVLGSLTKCGILSQSVDTISFKYRCFQEYFLAKHMGSSPSRLKCSYVNRAFVQNSRELEILSGLSRENDELIDEVIFQLEGYAPTPIDNISLDRFADVIEEESSIGISREKLRKIRKKKLTSTQVDDLMDAAEAQLATKSRSGGSNKGNLTSRDGAVTKKKTQPEVQNSIGSETLSEPRLTIPNFMTALSLLGKVLRNSEFTSKARKEKGVRLYTQSSAKFFLLMYEIVSDVFSDLVVSVNEDEAIFDEEAIRGLHYYLTKQMMLFVDRLMVEDLASVKLIPIIEEIIASDQVSASEKTFLIGLQLDCPNPNWNEHWNDYAEAFKSQRISLEYLADKLWKHIHSKALTPKEQTKVEGVALKLELALGRSKSEKGFIQRAIRTANIENKNRDTAD